ncbi:MAG: quinone-dependent dihydroorotate dehydrogenase [Corynebacterium sp.]|nr:quinone-dependent dihydroorotate dehydrogenase [Corynebacterium sp.]
MSRMRKGIYQALLQVFFRFSAETMHHMATTAVRTLQAVPPLRLPFAALYKVKDPSLRQEVFGVSFPGPLGLAAGFDKDIVAPDVWESFGFGYAELGTITAEGQPGNPQPRLFRLRPDKGILNRMGFNNKGAVTAAKRLNGRKGDAVLGINIGKTKKVDVADAVADYRRSATMLGSLADYMVVNVSSPNTPGLRDLQAVDSLRPILEVVQECAEIPVLVKIAPDLADEDIIAVADLAKELGVAGIVATNTTISREGLATPADEVQAMGAGGVSGPPVAARALEVLRLLHAHVSDDLVLIGVGGISTAEDAWERIAAGATLIQGYTGFIYGGPDWAKDINDGIARQLKLHNFSNISEAIGCQQPYR